MDSVTASVAFVVRAYCTDTNRFSGAEVKPLAAHTGGELGLTCIFLPVFYLTTPFLDLSLRSYVAVPSLVA